MTLLIDLDSILYKAVYRIVSISSMREALQKFGREGAEQWLNEEVYNEGINRCENQLLSIQNHIDSLMINDITGVELFITTCSNSFRRKLSKEYKTNRKKNKYVWMLRSHYQMNDAKFSDTLEADDLIAIRSRELGVDNCIVVSMDKDLKQIGGYYWSYYLTNELDHYGEPILDEYGNNVKVYKQKAIDYITKDEANLFFWHQVLTGDPGDNIKGLYRVGKKTADKILNNTNRPHIATMREYIKRNQKKDFWTNYKLIKLG